MNENLREQLRRLPELLGAHIVASSLALLIGLAISLPLGLLVARRERLRWVVLAAAGVIQTVPSLALLALMVPLLGAFGFWPALVALVLYSALPVLRNTVAGVTGVDSAVIEAARAVGMTDRQVLQSVELPLASPIIVAGIRTATVWVVGIATLSTPVGQASLGNYIFGGLQTRNWTAVLVGCGAAASLALVLDALLATLQAGAQKRRAAQWGSALGALALVLVAGALAPSLASAGRGSVVSVGQNGRTSASGDVAPGAPGHGPGTATPRRPLTIGAKTFTEQYILAALLELRLRRAGFEVTHAGSLGSSVAFDALRNGDIDMYVDYTGTLWANVMKRSQPAPAWQVRAETAAWLAREHGIRQLGALGFENAYALAMRRDRAEQLGVDGIDDLRRHAPTLRLGSDYEFFERPEWTRVKQTYGLAFSELESLDSSFMYSALKQGDVDVITAFSSDGRIAAYDLTVLSDPSAAFPPYDAVLLLAPTVAQSTAVADALAPLVGAIPVGWMREANLKVDTQEGKQTPAAAARWLNEKLKR